MKPNTSQPACIYARVSSELQEERGTIKSQIAEVKRHLAEAGDTLVREYVDDGYSGELLERPALDQLRTDGARELWKKVYVLSPDRLARKPHIAGLVIDELQSNGVEVIFINRPLGNTVEDHLLFGIQSLFAEYEKEKIKERQRRGKLFKARQGLVVGGQAPFGYRYVKGSDNGAGRYEIDEKEAAIVRMVYEWYTTGQCSSYRQIAKELYQRGIKTRRGRAKWSHAVISNILTDSTYVGTTYYNKRKRVPAKSRSGEYRRSRNTGRVRRDRSEWIPASVPPIVSQDLYDKAEKLKNRRIRQSPRRAREKYLVKNLIECEECGSALYGTYSNNRSGTRYAYYQCSLKQKRDPVPTDHRFTLPRDTVDPAVWNGLTSILTSEEVLLEKVNGVQRARDNSQANAGDRLTSLEKRQQELQTRRQRTINAYNEELLTLEEFKGATEGFKREAEELARETATVQEELDTSPQPLTPQEARQIVTAYRLRLEEASFEGRRKLVSSLVSKVVASGEELRVTCSLPPLQGQSDTDRTAFGSPIRSERNGKQALEFLIPLPAAPLPKRPRDERGRFVPA